MLNKPAKEPWFVVFLNQIITGLGQIYAGRIRRGTVFIAISLVFFSLTICEIYIIANPDIKINLALIMTGISVSILELFFRLFASIDAYRCAARYNSGRPSVRKSLFTKVLFIGSLVLFFINLYQLVPALYIRNNFVQFFKVPTISMSPTVMAQDRIVANKICYRYKPPQRGAVIVFQRPFDKRYHIKRIVGLPGETLQIKDGRVFINDSPLKLPFYYYNMGEYGKKDLKIEIPQGGYFVLGDNSISSFDSRFFGFVNFMDITGKVTKITWPLNRSAKIN
jgi:signal peptidase I